MNQTIKIGDSFALPIQFYDTDTKLGMQITDDMLITAQIINSQNQVIATPVIPAFQQILVFFQLYLKQCVSEGWLVSY